MEVDLGEHLGIMETVYQVINQGNGEAILDGDLVQGTVVDAHSQVPILLLDENDRGSIGGFARFDGSILEQFVQFLAHGIQFQWGHPIDGSPRGAASWFQFDAMIKVSFGREFWW